MELGINDSERMQRMYVLANMKGAEYSNKKIPTSRDTKGALAAVRRAEMWITEYTKDILPQGFNLPESGSSKKNKEIEILNAQKAAAKNIARFYAAGMHEGLGWDADMIQKAMSIAAKYYTEFQEQARAGDYAAYKLVRENAGRLLFGEEYDSTQEALPDFACTIW